MQYCQRDYPKTRGYDKNFPLILGLTGHAKSGKDTGAYDLIEFLRSDGINAKKIAFADPIRKIGTIFGFTSQQMSDQNLKETFCNPNFPLVTPRKFMQLVGSEMFRNNLDKDCWVKVTSTTLNREIEEAKGFLDRFANLYPDDGKIYPNSVILISDVRFPNEVEMIRLLGGKIVKISRPSLTTGGAGWMKHESEKYIDQIDADISLVNDDPSASAWGKHFTAEIISHFTHSTPAYVFKHICPGT